MTAARLFLVSLVTSSGLVAGLLGAVLWPEPAAVALLGLSLALDVVDGPLARYLDAATDFGAWLDWSTDTAVASALLWRLGPRAGLAGAAGLVFVQATSRAFGRRVSGRALLTVLLVVLGMWP